MKKLTKRAVVQALKDLISGYKEGNLYHSPASCSLCCLYMSTFKCTKECLNTVFGKINTDDNDYIQYPCLSRCENYQSLNWVYEKNNPDLAKFWAEVLVLIKASSPKDVREYSDELRAKVLEIAENYK